MQLPSQAGSYLQILMLITFGKTSFVSKEGLIQSSETRGWEASLGELSLTHYRLQNIVRKQSERTTEGSSWEKYADPAWVEPKMQ